MCPECWSRSAGRCDRTVCFSVAWPAPGTLSELRESLLAAETALRGGASPRVLPFTDVREAGALLQRAGFALPVADIDEVTVRYDTMFDLMRDLRAMGATNSLVQATAGRRPPGHSSSRRRASMRSAFPMRTAASARPSTRSGSRDGHRRRRSSSHSSRGARRFRWLAFWKADHAIRGTRRADYW